ncbi:MAG: PfkB family carbohydrate kinase [Cyclobacteriaceae bacterium]
MKKIAVVGPIPRDHIETHRGEIIQKYGCVTHPVIALSRLETGDLEVIPVAHLRKVDLPPVMEVFKGYRSINLSHVTDHMDQGAIISLKFIDQNNRLEKQTGHMDPMLPEDFRQLLDCQAFVFIPITDYEISLDTIKYLRANSKGVIIFDAHGPTTACLTSGERQRRFWMERDQWLPHLDVLKMNLEEAHCSWFKKEFDPVDFTKAEELDRDELRAFAKHALALGLKCLYVTVDSRGCLAYFMKNGQFCEEMIPAVKVDKVIDTTGCGDSFAGGLAFSLVTNPGDYVRAARYGNAFGALRTQGKTFDVFKTLGETEAIIARGHV